MSMEWAAVGRQYHGIGECGSERGPDFSMFIKRRHNLYDAFFTTIR